MTEGLSKTLVNKHAEAAAQNLMRMQRDLN